MLTMGLFELQNISFSYLAGIPTLRDISLTVSPGEFLSIVGPNGSGKSTLLKALDGLCTPQKGSIFLSGRDLSGYSRKELAKLVAVVPQEHAVQFPFTAFELVLMGRAPHSMGSAFESHTDYEIARAAMEKTDIAHLAGKPLEMLSGGERQRVFLARAFAQQTPIILLDEPNAHLDIAHQIELFGLMKQMNRDHGVTVIAASHDLNLAASYSDRIAMLLCGGLVAIGRPADVLTAPRIKEVFQTDVVIDAHPLHDSPRVTLGNFTGARRSDAYPAPLLNQQKEV
jgi:iron complex transport system ATP-binding protein